MKADCFYCKKHTDVDSISGLCVDCLILRAKETKAMKAEAAQVFDHKVAAAGRDCE